VNNFPDLNGLRILVVDDDSDNLELTSIILETYGVQVMKAASASEALKIVRQFELDVLISDIAMPEEDGYSLIRQIRQVTQIPTIALTALAMPEERSMALKSGFQLYLTKPVEPMNLVTEVAKLVGRSP
jgi:CheY-like chemotaxis protein